MTLNSNGYNVRSSTSLSSLSPLSGNPSNSSLGMAITAGLRQFSEVAWPLLEDQALSHLKQVADVEPHQLAAYAKSISDAVNVACSQLIGESYSSFLSVPLMC